MNIRFLLLPFAAALSVGCAATNEQAPTHRWASTEAADKAEYRIDHAQCASRAGLDESRAMAADSEAFTTYKQCMSDNGYVLTAYRDNR